MGSGGLLTIFSLEGILERLREKEKGTEPDGQSPWVAEPRWEHQTHKPKALQTYAVAKAKMTIHKHCTHAIKHSLRNSLQLWHLPHNNLFAIRRTFSMNYLLSGKEGRPGNWQAIFDQKKQEALLDDKLILSYIINFVNKEKEALKFKPVFGKLFCPKYRTKEVYFETIR